MSEGNAQAGNAIRNIRNHLSADPSAKIVVVTHAGGVKFLLDGALDGNGAPFEAAVQELKGKGVDFRVCRFTLERNKIDPSKVIPEARWCRPGSPKCPGCSSRKASPTCVLRDSAQRRSAKSSVCAIPVARSSEEKRSMRAKRVAIAALAAAALGAPIVFGQSTADEIEKYRQALQDGNPAELWEARGEGLWKQARGPKKVSFERCDLGLGPGVVKGAYAKLPRYFADADRVMDLETRLVHCMVVQQGFTPEDAKPQSVRLGRPQVGHGGAGRLCHVGIEGREDGRADAPREGAEAYALGEKMFYFRGGPHDFSCATCHGEDNQRIRLQDLPNLTKPEGAQRGYTTWPAYRVSQGELRTFQWRLYDCFRQQRFPELEFASEASVALTTFLAKNANGAAFNAPAIKR